MKIHLTKALSQIQSTNFGTTKNVVVSHPTPNDKFESEFEKEKTRILEIFKKNNIVKANCLEFLEDADDQEDLENQIGVVAEIATENLLNTNMQDQDIDWKKILKTRALPFEVQKFINKTQSTNDKKLTQLYKDLCEKDTNPRVKNIKTQLQNMGIKNIYLDNNLEEATRCLKAMKILKEKNFPLPKEIIINKHFPFGGVALSSTQTIILKPYEDVFFRCSTNSDLHKIIHECAHLTQPNLVAFNIKRIPADYQNTINNLSFYAKNNFAHEIHAELITKMLIEGLTKEEEKLLKYIES